MSYTDSGYIPAVGNRLSDEFLHYICGGSKELIDKHLATLELLEKDVKHVEMRAEMTKIALPLMYQIYYRPDWRATSQVHIWRDWHVQEIDRLRKSS
ncbi:hypothetical protein [Methylobacterium sp. 22177]|uniref:hypothetical protein n=1 Tax=Methylobacterium sp. 22177 TaxID=3453885 RepID=UPI003F853840